MTANILVVDDSHVDRCLIGGLLQREPGYHVELAADGREALERLATSPIDLVVTDLVMPELDGLELVRTMRQRHPEIPVVLMTAYGNEATAVEAIEAGAASYVPKARQAELLRTTVSRLLQSVSDDRQRSHLHRCTLEYQWRLELSTDPTLIRSLLAEIHRMMAAVEFASRGERIRVGEALQEALLNAMYHGNLEIGERQAHQWEAAFDDDPVNALVARRLREERFRDRKVLLLVRISSKEARFVIRDEGAGFNVAAITRGAPAASFEAGRHRGLTLIRLLMDEVRFNRQGNELTITKRSQHAVGVPT